MQIHDMLIDEDPFGQVKFVHLFKVIVHVIIMNPEIQFTVSAIRLYWS